MIKQLFYTALCLTTFSTLMLAQPSQFNIAPSIERIPGFLARGTAYIDGAPASTSDWVAMFDPNLICAGAAQIGAGGEFLIQTVVDNQLNPSDGGMDCMFVGFPGIFAHSGCENFTLIVWQAATGLFFRYPTDGAPFSFAYEDVDNNTFVDLMTVTSMIYDFTGAPTLVLPVEFLYFRGAAKGEKVTLDWATSAELNNSGFEVERSNNGERWERIGFVAGQGTTELEQTYTYTDAKPYAGVNYYRLKQVDFDGDFEYSSIVKVEITREGKLTLYPNPTKGDFWVTLPEVVLNSDVADLQLFDEAGRLVWKNQIAISSSRVPVSLPADLQAGFYLVSIQTADEVFRTNLIKQ